MPFIGLGKYLCCNFTQGANPNRGDHEHKYSTLHFAALSGNVEVCQLLLEHGADISTVNSVGRTPAQMAGFVGEQSFFLSLDVLKCDKHSPLSSQVTISVFQPSTTSFRNRISSFTQLIETLGKPSSLGP